MIVNLQLDNNWFINFEVKEGNIIDEVNSNIEETVKGNSYDQFCCHKFNAAMQAVQGVVIRQYLLGIDIQTPEYRKAISETIEGCREEFI